MTEVRLTATTAPRDSLLMASSDQETILGSGTQDDPLRAVLGVTDFLATFSSLVEPRLGNPVVATDDPPTVGVATVTPGSAGLGSPQLPNVVGIIIQIEDAAPGVTVRSSGLATLTAGEWDLVTGEEGGLTTGAAYYLDWGFNSFGFLTTNPPSTSGMMTVLIGVALSTTVMLLRLPAIPELVE